MSTNLLNQESLEKLFSMKDKEVIRLLNLIFLKAKPNPQYSEEDKVIIFDAFCQLNTIAKSQGCEDLCPVERLQEQFQ